MVPLKGSNMWTFRSFVDRLELFSGFSKSMYTFFLAIKSILFFTRSLGHQPNAAKFNQISLLYTMENTLFVQ